MLTRQLPGAPRIERAAPRRDRVPGRGMAIARRGRAQHALHLRGARRHRPALDRLHTAPVQPRARMRRHQRPGDHRRAHARPSGLLRQPGLREITGYAAGEVIGRNCSFLPRGEGSRAARDRGAAGGAPRRGGHRGAATTANGALFFNELASRRWPARTMKLHALRRRAVGRHQARARPSRAGRAQRTPERGVRTSARTASWCSTAKARWSTATRPSCR